MTATSHTPRRPGKAESLEAKHRKAGVSRPGNLLGGSGKQSALKMWKEQALARREGEVRLLPPQMTSYWHMIERTGLTQQLVTGRQAQGEGGLPESRAPQVPTSVYSQQRLFGVQTLHIPASGAYQFIR